MLFESHAGLASFSIYTLASCSLLRRGGDPARWRPAIHLPPSPSQPHSSPTPSPPVCGVTDMAVGAMSRQALRPPRLAGGAGPYARHRLEFAGRWAVQACTSSPLPASLILLSPSLPPFLSFYATTSMVPELRTMAAAPAEPAPPTPASIKSVAPVKQCDSCEPSPPPPRLEDLDLGDVASLLPPHWCAGTLCSPWSPAIPHIEDLLETK